MACVICHGPDLKGVGNVPSIAGRSPSYVVRQLWDIQSSVRHGTATQLMKQPVARLTLDDMIAIAAYAASLHP
jgi:cytochrome c553